VGRFDGNCIDVTEVHRFPNEPVSMLDSLQWDICRVFGELKFALAHIDKDIPYASIGIDGWGADYGLIDRRGRLLGNVYHYRDSRTEHIVEKLEKWISRYELFRKTASDLKRHYTLSQLCAQILDEDPILDLADRLLLIPDLLIYLFTGQIEAETTIAGTTQLLDAFGKEWNKDVLSLLGIHDALLPPLVGPCTHVGNLLPLYQSETGFGALRFVTVGSHDTASAVAAIHGIRNDSAFVSAGTTIVTGAETGGPIINDAAFEYGLKNCSGIDRTQLLIRNSSGFWILQQCKRVWDRETSISFADLSREAQTVKQVSTIIDPEAGEFENADDMVQSIRKFAKRTGQEPPMTRADYTRSIYVSLALQVKWCIFGLCRATGKEINHLHLIGGGANDDLFCELVASCTRRPLSAGPAEATVLGNAMGQFLAAGEVSSICEIGQIVERSVQIRQYAPDEQSSMEWESLYARFCGYKKIEAICTKT
jgi:rhamnulokinase